ncbi:hypothetical protein ACFSTC_54315 [Nonomuraea ferruginea]
MSCRSISVNCSRTGLADRAQGGFGPRHQLVLGLLQHVGRRRAQRLLQELVVVHARLVELLADGMHRRGLLQQSLLLHGQLGDLCPEGLDLRAQFRFPARRGRDRDLGLAKPASGLRFLALFRLEHQLQAPGIGFPPLEPVPNRVQLGGEPAELFVQPTALGQRGGVGLSQLGELPPRHVPLR